MAHPTPLKISQQFIAFLKEQELYELLPEIVTELEKESFRSKEISLISAVELSAAEKKEIESTLKAKWGEHPFIYTTDAVILSGMIVKFEDKIIDMSGRGKLTDLAQELKK
jgi:ATP synthase F1 delta subunit